MSAEHIGGEDKKRTTAAELSANLLKYLEDARFGTVKYEALADYFYRDELHRDVSDARDGLKSKQDNPQATRISETQYLASLIAFSDFEKDLHNKKTTVAGYRDEYLNIWGAFDELGGFLYTEAKAQFPNDSERVQEEVKKRWDETFSAAQEFVINPKR